MKYYEILGISIEANSEEIKKAYKKVVSVHHPDKNSGNADSERILREASIAYETLKDPLKRELYKLQNKPKRPEPIYAPKYVPNSYAESSFRDMNSYVNAIFNSKHRVNANRDAFNNAFYPDFKDVDVEIRKLISLEESINGSRVEVEFEYELKRRCIECDPNLIYGCKQFCNECNGKKYVEEPHKKKINITIPVGIDTGQKLRFVGVVPSSSGKAPKDLYVSIEIAAHDTYRRNGSDLYRDFSVSFNAAMNGSVLNIKHIDESNVEFKIPPDIKNGKTEIMIPGAGIKKVRDSGKGDMYISLFVSLPDIKTPRAKKLLEEFINEVYHQQ